ncbi:hypothetical protein TRFO_34680 [Tritrichomonas foetus]|uniref:Uncharacterized protein n=1 Tax=Tritrichomonas foetus TaxID=1144522 RepID=A0A1J4JID6_9EUKA|nr:hypothetical protein TRFO_34680 [Tritrichomonas foetus]|eukprot:OHS98952.1 hypothetical protein TRFO_34680 [Tritrichomonas foetus]
MNLSPEEFVEFYNKVTQPKNSQISPICVSSFTSSQKSLGIQVIPTQKENTTKSQNEYPICKIIRGIDCFYQISNRNYITLVQKIHLNRSQWEVPAFFPANFVTATLCDSNLYLALSDKTINIIDANTGVCRYPSIFVDDHVVFMAAEDMNVLCFTENNTLMVWKMLNDRSIISLIRERYDGPKLGRIQKITLTNELEDDSISPIIFSENTTVRFSKSRNGWVNINYNQPSVLTKKFGFKTIYDVEKGFFDHLINHRIDEFKDCMRILLIKYLRSERIPKTRKLVFQVLDIIRSGKQNYCGIKPKDLLDFIMDIISEHNSKLAEDLKSMQEYKDALNPPPPPPPPPPVKSIPLLMHAELDGDHNEEEESEVNTKQENQALKPSLPIQSQPLQPIITAPSLTVKQYEEIVKNNPHLREQLFLQLQRQRLLQQHQALVASQTQVNKLSIPESKSESSTQNPDSETFTWPPQELAQKEQHSATQSQIIFRTQTQSQTQSHSQLQSQSSIQSSLLMDEPNASIGNTTNQNSFHLSDFNNSLTPPIQSMSVPFGESKQNESNTQNCNQTETISITESKDSVASPLGSNIIGPISISTPDASLSPKVAKNSENIHLEQLSQGDHDEYAFQPSQIPNAQERRQTDIFKNIPVPEKTGKSKKTSSPVHVSPLNIVSTSPTKQSPNKKPGTKAKVKAGQRTLADFICFSSPKKENTEQSKTSSSQSQKPETPTKNTRKKGQIADSPAKKTTIKETPTKNTRKKAQIPDSPIKDVTMKVNQAENAEEIEPDKESPMKVKPDETASSQPDEVTRRKSPRNQQKHSIEETKPQKSPKAEPKKRTATPKKQEDKQQNEQGNEITKSTPETPAKAKRNQKSTKKIGSQEQANSQPNFTSSQNVASPIISTPILSPPSITTTQINQTFATSQIQPGFVPQFHPQIPQQLNALSSAPGSKPQQFPQGEKLGLSQPITTIPSGSSHQISNFPMILNPASISAFLNSPYVNSFSKAEKRMLKNKYNELMQQQQQLFQQQQVQQQQQQLQQQVQQQKQNVQQQQHALSQIPIKVDQQVKQPATPEKKQKGAKQNSLQLKEQENEIVLSQQETPKKRQYKRKQQQVEDSENKENATSTPEPKKRGPRSQKKQEGDEEVSIVDQPKKRTYKRKTTTDQAENEKAEESTTPKRKRAAASTKTEKENNQQIKITPVSEEETGIKQHIIFEEIKENKQDKVKKDQPKKPRGSPRKNSKSQKSELQTKPGQLTLSAPAQPGTDPNAPENS